MFNEFDKPFLTKLAILSAARLCPVQMSDDMMGMGIVECLAFQQPELELPEGKFRMPRQDYHRLG